MPALRVDGVSRSGLEELLSIQLIEIQEMRFLSPSDATMLYGTGLPQRGDRSQDALGASTALLPAELPLALLPATLSRVPARRSAASPRRPSPI